MNIVIGAGLTGVSLGQDESISHVIGPFQHTAMSTEKIVPSTIPDKDFGVKGIHKKIYIDMGIHVINTMTDKLKSLDIEFEERARNAVIFMETNGNTDVVKYPYQTNDFAVDKKESPAKNYDIYLHERFGHRDAENFHVPYAKKFWGQHYYHVGSEWTKSPQFPKGNGINEIFYYPKGGIGVIRDKLLDKIRDKYICQKVVFINVIAHKVHLADGTVIPYEKIYNTAPLPELNMVMPTEIRNIIESLKYTSIYSDTIYGNDIGYDWVYSADPERKWFRASSVAHDNTTQYESLSPSPHDLYIHRDFIKYAYIVPEYGLEEKVEKVQEYLRSVGIYGRGRYGRWGSNMFMNSCLEETI